MIEAITIFFRRKKKMQNRILQLEKQLAEEIVKTNNVVKNGQILHDRNIEEIQKLEKDRFELLSQIEKFQEVLTGKIYPYPKHVEEILQRNEDLVLKINQTREAFIRMPHGKECPFDGLNYYTKECNCGVSAAERIIYKLL